VVLLHRSTVDLVCHHTFPYVDSNTMNSNVAGKVAMLPSELLYKAEWKAIDHPSRSRRSFRSHSASTADLLHTLGGWLAGAGC
jgi:hypothetical protein